MVNPTQPIIIKKIKKVSGGGHHGGAWKVAYADFVTAMMAFFLLMWLLNATSEEQKKGISNYFGPVGMSTAASGSGGVLGGKSIATEGSFEDSKASPAVTMLTPQTNAGEAKSEGDEAKSSAR
jgi:chemotaxis protein MotB